MIGNVRHKSSKLGQVRAKKGLCSSQQTPVVELREEARISAGSVKLFIQASCTWCQHQDLPWLGHHGSRHHRVAH